MGLLRGLRSRLDRGDSETTPCDSPAYYGSMLGQPLTFFGWLGWIYGELYALAVVGGGSAPELSFCFPGSCHITYRVCNI
jgi:hypothetical protein